VAKAASGEPKKPYAVPELTVYGRVTDLTKSHSTGAHFDGGRAPHNKGTHLG
jgi:hypothetical protein